MFDLSRDAALQDLTKVAKRSLAAGVAGIGLAASVIQVSEVIPSHVSNTVVVIIGAASALIVLVLATVIYSLLSENRRWQAVYDRIYHFVGSEWRYSRSADDNYWAAEYIGTRELTSTIPGLQNISVSFTRRDDAFLPYDKVPVPQIRLLEASRSGPGNIAVTRPHKRSGTTFAFRINFVPGLRLRETAKLKFTVQFPCNRYAWREDVLERTKTAEGLTRDYDFNSRAVGHPMERMLLSVFLPLDLGAVPRPLLVWRLGQDFSRERVAVDRRQMFTVSTVEVDGIQGWLMKLERPYPPMNARYQLEWQLPSRSDVDGVQE